MTAPNVIWTASTDGKCHVGFDTPSANYTNRYIRADAQELVALVDALREVAVRHTLYTDGGELDWLIDDAKSALAAYEALK